MINKKIILKTHFIYHAPDKINPFCFVENYLVYQMKN